MQYSIMGMWKAGNGNGNGNGNGSEN